MGTNVEIGYVFAGMRVAQFATMEEEFRKDGEELACDISPRFAFDVQKSELHSFVASTLRQSGRAVAKIEVDARFLIAEASVEGLKRDGRIVFPAKFLVQAASLCYGSERGVLFERLEGTPLSGTILPPVYFHDIVTEELVVETEDSAEKNNALKP